ncbi:hypothetical protein NQ317_017264, partial [Molorchus minor]
NLINVYYVLSITYIINWSLDSINPPKDKYCNHDGIVLVANKMDIVDIQAVESKLNDVTVTAIPVVSNKVAPNLNHSTSASNKLEINQSKYAQLLNVIEEMGREVRPTYAGSRSSAERLKRNIVSARILVRECLIETERSARQ